MTPGAVIFLNTELVPDRLLQTAISGFPSPSRSPTSIRAGFDPDLKLTGLEKDEFLILPGDEVFFKMLIVFESVWETIRSAFPSASISAMARLSGPCPAGNSTDAAREE